MANQNALNDDNGVKSLVVESSTSPGETVRLKGNPATGGVVLEGGGGLEYNSTPPTLTNGGTDTLQGDVNANLKVREQYAPGAEDNVNGVIATARKPVVDAAYSMLAERGFDSGTYNILKAAPGVLGGLIVTNTNAALRYLLIVNTASAPSGSTGVLNSIPIPVGSATVPGTLMLDSSMLNLFMSTGVTLAVSTADGTYTAATAGDHTLNAWYF